MIAALAAVSTWACGPDFPDLLLDDRSKTLLDLPEVRFRDEAARFVPRSGPQLLVVEDRRQEYAEREGLAYADWDALAAMRSAGDARTALEVGRDLPEDVRLYTAGAVDYYHHRTGAAIAQWTAVMALPPADRQLRGTWAAYMLAETAEEPTGYARVRAEAAAGRADPAGLAVASYGEEARRQMWAGEWHEAVRLYAEQAAQGSQSGATSLLFVARELARSGRWRELVRADPLVRDLMVTYAWSHPLESADAIPAGELLAALPPSSAHPGAGRIAALAYNRADYAVAAQWAEVDASPLGGWIRAKLALRAGDLAGAAAEYERVVAAFPARDHGDADPERVFSRCRVQEERGALALARGEYVEALRVLLDAADLEWDTALASPPAWEDAAYVAERVLTVDELKLYVDQPEFDGYHGVREPLRALLARRLMREGRPADAARYFDDPEVRAVARSYAVALERTASPVDVERARAFLELGWLARPGLYLLGTELQPDYAVFAGSYTRWWDEERPAPDPRFTLDRELARVDASAPRPDTRFHYREVAARHALAAADLLPHTTLAYASALCEAASYVRNSDPEQFAALWQRYLRTGPSYGENYAFGYSCPEPDWDRTAEAMRVKCGFPVWVFLGVWAVGGLLLYGFVRARAEYLARTRGYPA